MAALSVVKRAVGQEHRDAALPLPQAESVARSSVLAATPPERASARMPSLACTVVDAVERGPRRSRAGRRRAGRRGPGRGVRGRAASRPRRAARTRAASRSSGPRRKNRASRRRRGRSENGEAVAAAARGDPVDDGPARVAEARAPRDLVEGLAGRVVARAGERHDAVRLDADELGVAARDDESVKRVRRPAAAARRPARRYAEKRCPSRWLTPTSGMPRANASALPAESPTSSAPIRPGSGGRRDERRPPRARAPASPSASSSAAGRFSRCARAATSGTTPP